MYEFGNTIGARLYCAKADLLDTSAVTEYSVLNAQLYDLHHVCGEHLYARTAAEWLCILAPRFEKRLIKCFLLLLTRTHIVVKKSGAQVRTTLP